MCMAKTRETTCPRQVRFTEDGPALEDILKALLRDRRKDGKNGARTWRR